MALTAGVKVFRTAQLCWCGHHYLLHMGDDGECVVCTHSPDMEDCWGYRPVKKRRRRRFPSRNTNNKLR